MDRRWVVSGLSAVLTASSLVAVAISSEHHVNGSQAALAARAAIAYVGGEYATLVRPGAPGYAWQFHVLRRNGSVTDVVLDENLELVDVGDSPTHATGYRAPTSNIRVARSAPTQTYPVKQKAKPASDHDDEDDDQDDDRDDDRD